MLNLLSKLSSFTMYDSALVVSWVWLPSLSNSVGSYSMSPRPTWTATRSKRLVGVSMMRLLESRNRYLEASTRRQLVSKRRETGSRVLASSMRIFSSRMRRRSCLYSMYALATSLCLFSSSTRLHHVLDVLHVGHDRLRVPLPLHAVHDLGCQTVGSLPVGDPADLHGLVYGVGDLGLVELGDGAAALLDVAYCSLDLDLGHAGSFLLFEIISCMVTPRMVS